MQKQERMIARSIISLQSTTFNSDREQFASFLLVTNAKRHKFLKNISGSAANTHVLSLGFARHDKDAGKNIELRAS